MSGAGQIPSPATGGAVWRLDGRFALVTGASAGLGARFARVLHQARAEVLATARRADLLDGLARRLAAQWGGRGVRVNALAPGYFPAELTGHLADAGFARSIREHTLLARTPALEEIDGPLLFLATAASSYMTGQVLVIDGGWTAV